MLSFILIRPKNSRLYSAGYILAAGTTGKDNTIAEGRGEKGGIVPGHAYSILDVYSPKLTVSDIKLVKLRNPWYELHIHVVNL